MRRFLNRNKKAVIISAIAAGAVGAVMAVPFLRKKVVRGASRIKSRLW